MSYCNNGIYAAKFLHDTCVHGLGDDVGRIVDSMILCIDD